MSDEVKTRELHGHKVNPANDKLKIEVLDGKGAGGAHHLYQISGFNTKTNPSCPFTERYGEPADHATILFQNGPIPEAGVNGVTQEALIAVSIDRLECFQAGPYACPENDEALKYLRAAQACLLSRTRSRMARGVEGTHEK